MLTLALTGALALAGAPGDDLREAENRLMSGQVVEAHGYYRRALGVCELVAREDPLAACIGERVAAELTGLTATALPQDEADLREELAAAPPGNEEVFLRIALLRNLYQQGRLEEVGRALEPVLAENGAALPPAIYGEMLSLGALALSESGRPAEGLALLDREPAGAWPVLSQGLHHQTRGRALFLLGRDGEAVAAYRLALESYGATPATTFRRLDVLSRLIEIYSETDFWAMTGTVTEMWSLQLDLARDLRAHPSEYGRMASYVYELPAHIRAMEAVGRWLMPGQRLNAPLPCGSGEIVTGRFPIRAVDPDTMVRLNVTMAYNRYLNQELEQSRRCALWAIHVVDRTPTIPRARKAPALLLLAVLENAIALEENRINSATFQRAMRLSRLARLLRNDGERTDYYLALHNAFDAFFASSLGDSARAYQLTRDSLRYLSNREAASLGRPLAPWWVRQSQDALSAVLSSAWAGAHPTAK